MTRRSTFLLGGFFLTTAAAANACQGEAITDACRVDSDCNPGRVCVAKVCTASGGVADSGAPLGTDDGGGTGPTQDSGVGPRTDGGDGSCPTSCATPPAASCLDSTTLRTYVAQGSCTAGACTYASYQVVCQSGCQDGQCTGGDGAVDPCSGVACVTPPPAYCSGDGTLVTYDASGTCSGGSCSYASSSATCSGGAPDGGAACRAGSCLSDPCAGVECNSPPAPTCSTGSTLKTYSAAGTCSGGTCTYAPTCPSAPDAGGGASCQAGACTYDPCAGVVCNEPPASLCVNGTTVQNYPLLGTCAAGTCTYPSTTMSCPSNQCLAGGCVVPTTECPDGCSQTPFSYCANSTTLVTYASDGECIDNNGTYCVYPSSQAACPASAPNCNANEGACTPWTPAAAGFSRYFFAVTAGADGNVYAAGGVPSGSSQSSGELDAYHPSTNTWTVQSAMPTPRRFLAMALGTDGTIYAVGGETGTGSASSTTDPLHALATVEAYSPTANTWSTLPSLPSPLTRMAAAVGGDGKRYVIGGATIAAPTTAGQSPFQSVATVEVYSPSPGSWSTAASLPSPRAEGGAVVAPDGRIYAMGGVDYEPDHGETLSSAVEAFTVGTNTWAAAQAMPAGADFLTAAVGADGRLWTQGATGVIGAINSVLVVNVFDPSSMSWSQGSVSPGGGELASVAGTLYAVSGTENFKYAP